MGSKWPKKYTPFINCREREREREREACDRVHPIA